ncbi:hypothetical protein BDZ89DRAFT_991189 [Hymenopellis radicata]|nr:hypothetical protein BDZ89DRAFT_991189 [Hymenopellis radicata]
MSQKLVHLIYIHGFRGDETTFQSFPTDLQNCLSALLPKELNIRIQSSLYPTYKSVKPISVCTHNFLEWLNTQPPGPVILLGHSMGGLLAAEAATHISNNPPSHHQPRRIMGMMAFDTPYLGMHPHVVITGIASLFDDDDGKKTETEMNHHSVKIVDTQVTDNWEEYKKNIPARSSATSMQSSSSGYLSPNHLGSAPASHSSSHLSISSHSSQSSSLFGRSNALVDRTMNFISSHSDDPLVRWMRKHSDEPFTAAKRWIIEHFQFGICMFDPPGLKERYTTLVAWNGLWVNYWSQTVPQGGSDGKSTQDADNDAALLETGMAQQLSNSSGSSNSSVSTQDEESRLKKLQKSREKEAQKGKVARHFIVLPTGLGKVLGGGDKWEKVLVQGVKDEVGAHCGLFIRGQNLEYDAFVERVGNRVIAWCRTL